MFLSIFIGMDINHIFNLFGDPGNKYNEEPPSEFDLEAFEKTPSFKIGMFKKIILNQHVFQKKLINMFKTKGDEYNVDGMEEVGEYMAHHRAWDHIKDCEVENEIWQDSFTVLHDEHLETAIKLSISFFEEMEEYEKCALLKKIELFLEDSLES
jgi:hypothetical protein